MDEYKLIYDSQTFIYCAPQKKCEEVRDTLLESEPERFKKELFTITQIL